MHQGFAAIQIVRGKRRDRSRSEDLAQSHRSSERERLTMDWFHDAAYLFGGAFLANAVPHFVSGMLGRPFQSPFAKPPGKGLSSSTVNVLWGFSNFVMAYLLIARVGNFDLRATDHVVAAGVGVLLIGVTAARGFGRFHGGNSPPA
jgi:hypothetical protein